MPSEITFQEAAQLASQCETWDDFQRDHTEAYNTACRRLWVDELVQLCQDTRFNWTPERLTETAREYQSRAEFVRDAPGAYIAARDLGILDEVCQHMTD